jgi:hypothetical protein
MKADMKRTAPTLLGDLLRSVWRLPGKTKGRCLDCAWRLDPAFTHDHVAKMARQHSRERGHVTRFISAVVVEYRPGKETAGK